jgi:hypothetical protein
MTPNVYTNLRILNCTSFPLETSDVSFYQMNSTLPTTSPLLGPKSYSTTYLLQFTQGVGDETDSGNVNFMIETDSIAVLYAGSTEESGHYMQVTLKTPGASFPLAFGLVTTADWPQSSELSSLVSWYVPPVGVNLGDLAVPGIDIGPNKALAIVDLSQIYPQADVNTIQSAIQGNTLATQQVEDLWTKVSNYTQIVPSS